MPDPHKDLAAIIEPAAPPPAASFATSADYPLPLALAAAAVLLVAWRFWRRRAPLRALRRLASAPDAQAGAAGLARLMAGRVVPEPWRQDLERLRFARPAPDAATTLARLCREAEGLLRARSGNK